MNTFISRMINIDAKATRNSTRKPIDLALVPEIGPRASEAPLIFHDILEFLTIFMLYKICVVQKLSGFWCETTTKLGGDLYGFSLPRIDCMFLQCSVGAVHAPT